MQKILIAEDEKPIAGALENKLTHEGYEAKVVGNGQEALDELKANQYDLLLLDLMMPVMDGYVVLEEIKKQNIPVSVMVLSNLGQEEEIQKAKALGAKDFLVKANTPIMDIIDKIKASLD